MEEFLARYGLTVESAGLIVGLLTLVPVVLAIRRPVVRAWRKAVIACGFIDRRYVRWFVATHQRAFNPVLEELEEVSLDETYIPLTIAISVTKSAKPKTDEPAADDAGTIIATSVMSSPQQRTVMIVGEPGTGKSTLLRAYGVGILRRSKRGSSKDMNTIMQSTEVPILVPLRAYGSVTDRYNTLEAFLVQEILQRQAGLGAYAELFLQRLLKRRRCLVLLDGIDEVSAASYVKVRDEIRTFRTMHCRSVGVGARVIATCRTQNFNLYRHEWIGDNFTPREYTLAPFRDSDIKRYAAKLEPHFSARGHTPNAFVQAVMTSNAEMIKLHRNPLVLSMSIGLYARIDGYEIPPSVAILYKKMVSFVLSRRERHFLPDAKLMVLREFALESAIQNGFGDFARPGLLAVTQRVIPRLANLRPSQAGQLADEILVHSGLVVRQSDDGYFNFNHRSIFEYLAAEQLSRDLDNANSYLMSVCDNPEWRQATLFYVSEGMGPAEESPARRARVAELVSDIGRIHPDFAAYCLGQAIVDTVVAAPILAKAKARVDSGQQPEVFLPALLRAVHSPSAGVRELAVELSGQALKALLDKKSAVIGYGGDVAALTAVVGDIAKSKSPEMIALIPDIVDALPEDAKLVRPLVECLEQPLLPERSQAAILNRLLLLARRPAAFAELEAGDIIDAPRFSDVQRHKAFPFKSPGHRVTNLVTVLTWAESLGALPVEQSDGYFYYKRRHPRKFAQVERARRFTFRLPLEWLPRTVTWLGAVVGLAFCVYNAFTTWKGGIDVLIPVLGAPRETIFLTPPAVAVFGMMLLAGLSDEFDLRSGGFIVPAGLLALIHAIALLPLAIWSVPGYMAIATAVGYLAGILPLTKRADRVSGIYFPPLNPCLFLYDDIDYAHWISSRPRGGSRYLRGERRARRR